MEENKINIVSDCVEAVYNEVLKKNICVPLKKLEELIEAKTKPSEYEILKNIARGGYGEVFLVKREKMYAMKRVSKEMVLKQPHTALFMAEKEAMIDCIGSEWLACARQTIQDGEYLYYFMDFIPGGDLMGLLSKEDVLEENWVRFYASEIVAALDELHKLGWIHRDLKPDNVLIRADGHIKLADFGCCIRMIDGKARSSVTVGTPDYVSPDVLCSMNEECEYGEDVDFWMLGVVIYEMIYGTTPFYSDTLMETYRKITRTEFEFPFCASAELTDLIKKLITTKENRIGIDEIKRHVFFREIDWKDLKKQEPPFVPKIHGDLDTSHFIDSQFNVEELCLEKKGNYIPFVGFTFDPVLVSKLAVSSSEEVERRIHKTTDNDVSGREECSKELSGRISASEELVMARDKELAETVEMLTEAKMKLEMSESEVRRHKEEIDKMQKRISISEEALKKTMIESKQHCGEVNYTIEEGKSGVFEDLRIFMKLSKRMMDEVIEDVHTVQCMAKKLGSGRKEMVLEAEMYREKYYDALNAKMVLESDNKELGEKLKSEGLESLKKQLRLKMTEIRECEQKLDQEIFFRKSIEEELSSLKKEKSKAKKVALKGIFSCHLVDGEPVAVRIDEDQFWIGEEHQCVDNVYISELKSNELHHLSQKKRQLTLKIVFMNEDAKSASSCGRRSLKSLEDDLNTELSVKGGIEKIKALLTGKMLEEANMQLEGSNRKICQLRVEIERNRRDTLAEEVPDDPIKIHEFNNHLFSTRTVPQGTLCDFCNEILYGLVHQGFECRDCKMVVHKSCYVLGDISCELYSALRTGKIHYLVMKTIEEKKKLLSMSTVDVDAA